MASGVYIIKNTVTNKVYVGSTSSFSARESSHFSSLRKNRHPSQKLQNSWNKYGSSAFKFLPYFYCPVKDLVIWEQVFIDLLNTVKVGYNIRPTAENNRGWHHSPESCKKMSEKRKGKPLTEEHRIAKVRAQLGRVVTEESRIKMSQTQKGRKRDPILVEKTASKLRGRRRPPMSEETKRKLSEASKRQHEKSGPVHPSEETRKKRSESKKANFESKKAQGIVYKHSEETRKLMSEKVKAGLAKRRLANL